MVFGTEAYGKLLDYLENKSDFKFLENIPGSDGNMQVQKEAILRLLNKSSENEIFLDYISYTYNIIKNDIIAQILSLTWTKSSGAKKYIIDDDKFGLDEKDNINSITLLLIIKDIMHTSYIASLPVYNEYRYKQNDFTENVKETIDIALDTISSTEPSISPLFLSLAAKSIIPYSKLSEEVSSISRLLLILFHLSRIMGIYPYTGKKHEYTKPVFLSSVTNLINNASFFGLDYNMLKSLYERVKSGEVIWKEK